MRQGFFDKFLSRLDRIDAPVASAHIEALARERGFLETLFQSIDEGILVLGDGMRLLYANHAAEKMIGFRAEQERGHSLKRYLRDWDIESLLLQQVEHWAHIETREVEISYPEQRVIAYYARPVEFDGRAELLLMLRDVTRERLAEEDTLADERLAAVKTLVAGVAHEIGNPLNALTIHLQLLERELRKIKDEDLRNNLGELTEVASQEVARLDGTIRRFLSVLRPSAPQLVRGNVCDVIETTLKVLAPDLERRHIRVQYTSPPRVPDVFLDAQQMEQVFFNLIKNAMEALEDHGKIGVTVDADDAMVSISVLDNGCGIPEEVLGRIFDPYVTTKVKGSGLGLMVVRRIVQTHGGTIACASHVGDGTCFTLRLPRAERQIRTLEMPSQKA